MRFLPALLTGVSLATGAVAQDRPNTILVMDGSGSMWGQIDGVAKITIAQDVVGDLLQTFPDDQGLGLTVYGHRERGNCTDIETVVAPAPGTRDAIIDAVNGIKPLGKTPMTDAIIAAAEALRYTEDSATVILVSDGVETCNPDPCAAARLLEEAGIDFTAHVIGFDVGSDADALAQMQCIADETGGDFLTADNAIELTDALTAVVEDPEPALIDLTLEARIASETGPLVEDPVIWTFGDAQDGDTENPFVSDTLEGTYEITAYRLIDELEVTREIAVNRSPQVEVFVFPEATPTASLDAPSEVIIGETFSVGWTGPDDGLDNIQIAEIGGTYLDYTYTSAGNPLTLVAPGNAGEYELRYVWKDSETIYSQPILVQDQPVFIDAPDSVAVGETFTLTWEGPDAGGDNIQIGDPAGGYDSYIYTERGNPLEMTAPGTVGTYELRYRFRDRETIYTRPLEVTPAELALDAPDSVEVGSSFDVTWTGPNAPLDNIQIGPSEGGYSDYSYTSNGQTVTLTAPSEPGIYELRYRFRDRETIFTQPIEVTEAQGSLQFEPTAPIGATVMVAWDGPDNDNDYIAVGPVGERYINYTRTRAGNPLGVMMPTEPGQYEIRYHLHEGGAVISSAPIEVTDLKGSITAPDTAIAGESLTVGWDGPDYDNDYLSVGPAGERYINYTRSRAGNPLQLLMPTEPGDYQIRYQMHQNGKIIATHDITVTDVAANLTFDAEATAGSTLTVAWDGPDYDNDYISVGKPGERYINYTRTRAGNPLGLLLPNEPGDYEVRYQLHQGGDIIASAPLKIVDVGAMVTAPDTAVAGSTVSVGWDGPDYDRDYIAVGPVGERYINYTRTSSGNPVQLLMPTEAGEYEIRYHLQQGGDVLASRIITLEPVKAEVSAPATANIGEPVTVTWDGPDYDRDYIAVSEVGDNSYVNYVRTSAGNPAVIPMPPTAGDYEIRYVLQQGGKVVARSPITVEAIKAQLVAPPSGVADTAIPVGWDGPDYSRDYVAIYLVGGDRYTSYTRTSAGNPLMLELPEAPGDYEIRYIMHQGGVVLANVPFTVTAE
ncbi:vWA domain-containing protein [Yoonia sp. 208BN28-4]|uniref:vWA domain-containing protein n=1 Tax=Yoonia sp. 208BN28-4 TaxID=3126505 RepID=UPI0030B288D4